MSSQPATSVVEPSDKSPPSSLVWRVAALTEVLVVFVLVHLSYRSFKHFTEFGKVEVAAGLNFSTGGAMILFTVATLLFFRRSYSEYVLTLDGWRYNLNVGLLWGVLTAVAAGVIVRFAPIRIVTHGPPDMTSALVLACGGLFVTFLLVCFLM